jgi:Mitochondrial ribosomal protein (VAR1)
MNNRKNFLNLTYNKYDFYHNEWYLNVYNYNKNYNTYNILNNNLIYFLLNIYFNKTSTIKKSIIKNNNINSIINKYKILLPNVFKVNLSLKKYYSNIFDNVYFNISEIKYYSNKIIVNLYVYNREKFVILRKLRLLNTKSKSIINVKNKENFNNLYENVNLSLKRKLILLNNKLYLYKYYTSKLFINNLKFNTYNLLKLKKIFSVMLSKKVLLNITNIKYFHLNSNIFLDTIAKKLNKSRKNSVLTLIRKGLRYAKIAKLHFLLTVKRLNNYLPNNIHDNYKNILKFRNNNYILEKIFSKNINTHITGLRIEAKGRLTKRLVASRAIKKLKYKGSLNNIYSSINKNSVITFRGHERSNISYSNKNSYNLLGSYGIKYWISSY